jgi:hypothetical protein
MPVPGQSPKCMISVNDASLSTDQDKSKVITLADQDNRPNDRQSTNQRNLTFEVLTSAYHSYRHNYLSNI